MDLIHQNAIAWTWLCVITHHEVRDEPCLDARWSNDKHDDSKRQKIKGGNRGGEKPLPIIQWQAEERLEEIINLLQLQLSQQLHPKHVKRCLGQILTSANMDPYFTCVLFSCVQSCLHTHLDISWTEPFNARASSMAFAMVDASLREREIEYPLAG